MRYGEKLVDLVYADQPTRLTAIAYLLVEHPFGVVDGVAPKHPGVKPDYSLALKAATRACELCHYAEPQRLDILAQVYSAMGQADKALETELRASRFAINPDDEMRQRLEQYRKTAGQKER